MKTKKSFFGTLSDGTTVSLYTVTNGDFSFSACNLGCIITNITMNDKHGIPGDIVLGFSTLDGYVNSTGTSFGALIGRYANRIGGASFEVNGEKYSLDANDGANCLHSGYNTFEKKMWNARFVRTAYSGSKKLTGAGIEFTRTSAESEQGFPGTAECAVTYFLTKENSLWCLYSLKADKDTPVNLTNHSYFNLGNTHRSESVANIQLQLFCKKYLEVDKNLIPTGKLLDVEGTPFDFTKMKKIGRDIAQTGIGYDHCFATEAYDFCSAKCSAVAGQNSELVHAASAYCEDSGRRMEVYTDQEGVQFYTANWIEGIKGKNGYAYRNHDAFCLETQCFPDSPNKSQFPSCIVKAGSVYNARTVYIFSVK